MKITFCAIAATACLLSANTVFAQTDSTKTKHKKHTLTITFPNGIQINNAGDSSSKSFTDSLKDKSDKDDKKFKTNMTMLDLGINILQDKTNYQDPAVKNYLHVPAGQQNASLFDLRQGKSINVNIYPFMFRYRLLKTGGQRIYLTTGLGLQLYNFRYEQPLTYTRSHFVDLANTNFHKDKVALDYLNIPLMLTFKTKLYSDNWLVYGGGITGGYRIASWTKQESGMYGKVKVHDAFDFADFNSCVTAEIGIDDMFRFYGSYQLTNLYSNALNQHPVSFGIRFSGI